MRSRSHSVITSLTALLLALAGVVAVPGSARAKREETFNYAYARVWTTAVRLLRVDFECPITEKDKDEGYFFFEYADHGKQFPGSVELVPSKEGSVETVRVVINVSAMPTYVESMMLEKLGRRLREDYGEPKGPPPEAPKPDAPQNPDGSPNPNPPAEGSNPKPAAPKPAPKPAPRD
jgi:hypothetical protein